MDEQFPAFTEAEDTYQRLSQTNYDPPLIDSLEESINTELGRRADDARHDRYPDFAIDETAVIVRPNGELSAEAIVYDDVYGAKRPIANVQLTMNGQSVAVSNNQETGLIEEVSGVSSDDSGIILNDDIFDLYCTQEG